MSLTKEGGYIHLDEIDWTPERLKTGVAVKLKKVPFKVKLFKLVATNGDIDWLITNDLDDNLTRAGRQRGERRALADRAVPPRKSNSDRL